MSTGSVLEIHIAEAGARPQARGSVEVIAGQGIELCEPCAHLAATVNAKVLPHLAHTGLRAAILSSGTIHSGDTITSS